MNGTSSSKIYNEWKRAYRGIRATSYFLENVDKVPSGNTALINQLKGEAKVLRAYQYIKLAGLYGSVPLVTTSISIDESRTLQNKPVAEIWDFIDKELNEAAALLPGTYPASDNGRITKGAALGLAARASLYAGRYEKAAAEADLVIKSGVMSCIVLMKNCSLTRLRIIRRFYLTGSLSKTTIRLMCSRCSHLTVRKTARARMCLPKRLWTHMKPLPESSLPTMRAAIILQRLM
nr:RagB/SusD family nutrient uptake outer membrane protein [Dyadobacter alkalitolerans]